MMQNNSKLEAARRLRGWTLEVASQKIGVHPQTLRRWETGKSKPRGFRIYKISEVYGMTPRALGIGTEYQQRYFSSSHFPPDHVPLSTEDLLFREAVEPLVTIEDLDLRLLALILQRKLDRHNLAYGPFQQQIHRCIKEYDEKQQTSHASPQADSTRAQALRVVASLPITLYLEDTGQHSLQVHPAEILTHCSGAITACWHMDLSEDLGLARTFISAYILLLSEIFTQFEYCRHAAAELIAQACLLRTMLATRLEGTHTSTSVSYYTRALEFSQIAENARPPLTPPTHALHTPAHYSYGKQPAHTLQKLAEALWLLKPAPPPPDFPLVRDYLRKISSAQEISLLDGDEHDHALSDEILPPLFFPETIDYAEAALNLWDGLTYYELGEYVQALDSSRLDATEEPVCDAPEPIRAEFLHNRALASLRLHDMDHGITTLRAAIPQVLSTSDEQKLVETREAYQVMQFLLPADSSTHAQELKDLLKMHD